MNDKELFAQIVTNNAELEEKTFAAIACRSIQGLRRFPEREKIPDSENFRPVFYHDTDKIIHSQVYTRYIDKTQVFSLFENDHITHRVLHVQFVSKVARVIGRSLRLNEDLIEAIALGHDLGHAPYGHDGETILNELCQEHGIGYFCHNAQSVRHLMHIECGGLGLNLALQVMDGILAHNGEILNREYRPELTKIWDDFDREYEGCFNKPHFSKGIRPMTLEGCVMRISDVIAYIGRDIEDAITLKLLQRKEIPISVKKRLGDTNATIIDALVRDLILHSYDRDCLEFSEDIFNALEELFAFNKDYIYLNPKIKHELPKIRAMYRMLFDQYMADLDQNRSESAIVNYVSGMNREYIEATPPERIVIDFLAGMTDDYMNNQFKRHFLPRTYGYHVEG